MNYRQRAIAELSSKNENVVVGWKEVSDFTGFGRTAFDYYYKRFARGQSTIKAPDPLYFVTKGNGKPSPVFDKEEIRAFVTKHMGKKHK